MPYKNFHLKGKNIENLINISLIQLFEEMAMQGTAFLSIRHEICSYYILNVIIFF